MDADKLLVDGAKFLRWADHEHAAQPVTLRTDAQGFFLQWREHSRAPLDHLDLALVVDVRTGSEARTPRDAKLRDMLAMGQDDLRCRTITVVSSTDFVTVAFVNFVASDVDICEAFHAALARIVHGKGDANRSCLQALNKLFVQTRLFANEQGRAPLKSVLRLFSSHKDERKRVQKALQAADFVVHKKSEELDLNGASFDAFLNFYTKLAKRDEIEAIFKENCKSGMRDGCMIVGDFVDFVNNQRDPRLNEILFPFCTDEKAKELILKYEPSNSKAKIGRLSLAGFLRYLLSTDNEIVAPELLETYDDMQSPLCHYFIQSSHNTYLTGHQWTGRSSVEMYRQVLLAGCRCIELDLWDGRTKDEEPVIVHGYTLVPEILAKDVIAAIAECAFKSSDYPLILSFENHCKPRQQAKIAQYCKEHFGDMLLSHPLEEYPLESGVPLPSPHALRGKILIKNKKMHIKHTTTAQTTTPAATVTDTTRQEGDDESSDSDEEVAVKAKALKELEPSEHRESKAAEEISALVNYTQAVRFHGFTHAERRGRAYEMSSFDETTGLSLLKENPLDWVQYNKRQLSRIFPKGTRLDSSNFMPQIFWNAGCQMVALNYQSLELPMQLNLAVFEYNGGTGYLKKPDFLCRNDKSFDPFSDVPVDGIVPGTVSIQVLSGQFLTDRHVGVFVEVDMFGLPCDTVRRKFKTKIVANNGICPQFKEDPFVFRQVVLPDLAVVRLSAHEESGRYIGHRVLPVSGIRPGYRHVMLRNEIGQLVGMPTLFVHVKVQDYVPDRLSDFADALANPIQYQSELEMRERLLQVLIEEMEEEEKKEETPTKEQPINTNSDLVDGAVAMTIPSATVTTVVTTSVSTRTTAPAPTLTSPQSSSVTVLPLELSTILQLRPVMEKLEERDRKVLTMRKKYDKEIEKLMATMSAKEEKLTKTTTSLGQKSQLSRHFSSMKRLRSPISAQYDVNAEKLSLNEESGCLGNGPDQKVVKIREQFAPKIEKLKAEKSKSIGDLMERFDALVLNTAEKQLRIRHDIHLKQLQASYEAQCASTLRRIESEAESEMKEPREKDKEELNRMKREKRSFIVKRGLAERRKLDEEHKKKIDEAAKNFEDIKKALPLEVSKMRTVLEAT